MKKMAYMQGICGQISVWKVEESGKPFTSLTEGA